MVAIIHREDSSANSRSDSCFSIQRILTITGLLSALYVLIYFLTMDRGKVFVDPVLRLKTASSRKINGTNQDFLSTPHSFNKANATLIKNLNNSDAYFPPVIAKNNKVVFFWNDYFDAKDWGVGFGKKPFKSCQYKDCITTNDLKQFNNSDAVLCHMRSRGSSLQDLPKVRPPGQYLIFFLMESPVNSLNGGSLTPYNGIFNMTITYKHNSNLTHSYSERNKVISLLKDPDHKFHEGKTTSVAWITSNCYAPNVIKGRKAYFTELSKYIQSKRYGRCPGHAACGKDCYAKAAVKHKFYFAAENSLCKDYITEKPWKALETGMIPIVYGLGNYADVLPPKSYIDVRDFKSPRILANYLKKVAKDRSLYLSYFEWRKTYVNAEPKVSHYCKLCAFLHQPNLPSGILHHIDIFWSSAHDCVNPRVFHKSVMQASH